MPNPPRGVTKSVSLSLDANDLRNLAEVRRLSGARSNTEAVRASLASYLRSARQLPLTPEQVSAITKMSKEVARGLAALARKEGRGGER